MTSRKPPAQPQLQQNAGDIKNNWLSKPWLWLVVILGGLLAVLFHQSFQAGQVLFANDVTLGQMSAAPNRLPGAFTGIWYYGGWIGVEGLPVAPTISAFFKLLFSPVLFLKFYAPFTLFFIGFSAWVLFRQLQFSPMASVLGGVAAGLNGHFFSVACWGEGNWNIAVACAFLAMAAVSSKAISQIWARGVLAGIAVGIAVMEGFDVGAILAIFVGIFIAFRALTEDAPLNRKIANALISEVVVILFAGLAASHTILNLVQTQVQGISAMSQDTESKKSRWNSDTQWSLPKVETLQVIAPGLFGYRLPGNIPQKDHSSEYWGTIGQTPLLPLLASDDSKVRQEALSQLTLPSGLVHALDTPDRHSRTPALQGIIKENGLFWRYSGTGECAGIMVTLLALFGLANLWRPDPIYSKPERMMIGFWAITALFCLVASWGKFAFLYSILYHLPYISTIRNPIKFMNPFQIALVILASYGLEAIFRRYLRGSAKTVEFLPIHLKRWWSKVAGFDRRWTISMFALAVVSAAGCVLLYANKAVLVRYLEDQAFNPAVAAGVADFCISSALWFLLFLVASIIVICGALSGAWSGERRKWAWIFLAALILVDLTRADIPWVRYYDYGEKYSADPLLAVLADKPYEHRFTARLEPTGPGSGIANRFGMLCYYWLQNDFPYDGIQSLDFAQMPRMQDLDHNYLKNFTLTSVDVNTVDLRPALRLWQLTNTRYYGGSASMIAALFDKADTNHQDFRILSRFNVSAKYGVQHLADGGDMVTEPAAKVSRWQYALLEYTRALPRAKLFSNWRTSPDDDTTLKTLFSSDFEPLDTLLVSKSPAFSQPDSSSTTDPGTVTITDYRPKDVQLDAEAKTASVLLLNDRINPDWHVKVDGQPAPVLRCNYIMRGVYLTAGHHTVEFNYSPSLKTLYVSVGAIATGLLLAGYLAVSRKPVAASIPAPSTPLEPAPAPSEPQPTANKPAVAPLPKRKKPKKAR